MRGRTQNSALLRRLLEPLVCTPNSPQSFPHLATSGGSVGARGELSLAEVQCHLDREGASDLVIDLIMNATSDRIFQESILLAIALLEGGNPVIQVIDLIF